MLTHSEIEEREDRYYCLEYSELEDLLNEFFGTDNINVCLERENDSYFVTYAQKGELDESDREDIEGLLKGASSWGIDTALTLLCNDDLIPEGNYLISVSW